LKKIVLAVTLAASLSVIAAPALAGGATVKITDYKFTAKIVHIKRGSTVTWKWAGMDKHNVTGRGFKSRTQLRGTFRHRFTKAGTYRYFCSIHRSLGMHGTIVVS
jgi:plastocyanin